MPYRYTNTDKWNDAWFSNLKPLEKLLFNYLCDNCDIAGFVEVIIKDWASKIGEDRSRIEGALKGLERGLIFSNERDCIYIRTFLKHQKNLPLNPFNKAHIGIMKRFDAYAHKFDIKDINEFIEMGLKGASMGLNSPTGIGNGNGNGNILEGGMGETIPVTWKDSFEVYQVELREAFRKIVTASYLKERQTYHPNLDIRLSLEKACKDYWATEAGWQYKKRSRIKTINWEATFNNSLTLKQNQVWKPMDKKPQEQPGQIKLNKTLA